MRKLFGKFLCYLGYHKWTPEWRGYGSYYCERCKTVAQ